MFDSIQSPKIAVNKKKLQKSAGQSLKKNKKNQSKGGDPGEAEHVNK